MCASYVARRSSPKFSFFFFNDTATTEIYTLSLHDALPICLALGKRVLARTDRQIHSHRHPSLEEEKSDRKSTRLNSSHLVISYAVFCLKKKKTKLPMYSRRTPTTLSRNSLLCCRHRRYDAL